jgi:hypothetical protein
VARGTFDARTDIPRLRSAANAADDVALAIFASDLAASSRFALAPDDHGWAAAGDARINDHPWCLTGRAGTA